MKDTFSSTTPAAEQGTPDMSGDWVVIRRRAQQDRSVTQQDVSKPDAPSAEPAAKAKPEVMAKPTRAVTQPSVYDAPKVKTSKVPLRGNDAIVPVREPAPVVTMETPETLWSDLTKIRLGAQMRGKPARGRTPGLLDVFRADPIAKGFDQLRTRLVRTIRAYGWRRIAVVSPTQGCGTTFTAVNLALSLSRVPASRTILMDMNQRRPGVAKALGLRTEARLDQFLNAEVAMEDYLVRGEDTLVLGLSGARNTLAAETLHDPLAGEVLGDMIDALDPTLVIYDMPAMLEHDDLSAFLPQVDGVLLVADGTQTTPEHIAACERILDGQIQLLGVVLNRGRADTTTA